jgi:hypothetical protein
MAEACAIGHKDLAGRTWSVLLLWGLPTAALVLSTFAGPILMTAALAISLLWMGAACLVNASRCGRMHCYFTGPFFLLLAIASFLHGLGTVWLGSHGWRWLGLTLLFGWFTLHYVPERVWGRYAGHAELE